MSSEDTTAPTVPVSDARPPSSVGPPAAMRGPHPGWFAGGALLLLAAALAIFILAAPASWVGFDDYVLAPGSATDTAGAVRVDGADTYAPAGRIAFTTVSIRREPTIYQYWHAGHDSAELRVAPELIDGDRTANDARAVASFQMTQSQDAATIVALTYLGYDVVPEVDGAFVVGLTPGSPAATALQLGDLIVAVDDAAIGSPEDLGDAIRAYAPGDTVQVTYLRSPTVGGSGADPEAVESTSTLTLAQHPDDASAGFLGVSIQTPMRADAPFDVTLDVGRVRGPSAGLAFSLAILDVLTPGELTGGAQVATTGTISPGGFVGPVGGVPQKVEAAVDAGIDLFLVPPFEYSDAYFASRGRLEVQCVQTFGDALLALDRLGGNASALAAERGLDPPQPAPNVIDADDGVLSCAEAEADTVGGPAT